MSSFSLAEGMVVPNLDGIHECYEVKERNDAFTFTANVSTQNIEKLIRSFCKSLNQFRKGDISDPKYHRAL